jgi:hypothetical protein
MVLVLEMGIVTTQSEYSMFVVSLVKQLMYLQMLIHFLLHVMSLCLMERIPYVKHPICTAEMVRLRMITEE